MISINKGIFTVAVAAIAAAHAFAGNAPGAFKIMLSSGKVLTGNGTAALSNAEATNTIHVRGAYVEFDLEPATFTVRNYSIVSRATARNRTSKPTMIFGERVPILPSKLTSGVDLTLFGDQLSVTRAGSDLKMTIVAKDSLQGEVLQIMSNQTIAMRNTLAPSFSYYKDGFGGLTWSNGVFVGRENAVYAGLTAATQNVALWIVKEGGSLGLVLGNDSIQP